MSIRETLAVTAVAAVLFSGFGFQQTASDVHYLGVPLSRGASVALGFVQLGVLVVARRELLAGRGQ